MSDELNLTPELTLDPSGAAAQAAAMELPDIHRVDVSALQESLLRRGAYLHIDQA